MKLKGESSKEVKWLHNGYAGFFMDLQIELIRPLIIEAISNASDFKDETSDSEIQDILLNISSRVIVS